MAFNITNKNLYAVVFTSLFLTACGGGGGGSSDTSTSTSQSETLLEQEQEGLAPSPVNNGADITNSETAALTASNEFSIARSSCGLGGLSLDPELEDIAVQHTNYIKYAYANATPYDLNPHYERTEINAANATGVNNPFFTGEDFRDRLLSAEYNHSRYGVTENIAQVIYESSNGVFDTTENVGSYMARMLLAAPYHLRSLMTPALDVTGSGVTTYTPYNSSAVNYKGYILVNHAAITERTNGMTVGGVFTYPCEGVTNTVTALYNETPDPVIHTGRDLREDPIGQPIYVNIPTANIATISNIKFHDVARGFDVPVQLIDYRADPFENEVYELLDNEAFILPLTDDLRSCSASRQENQNCGLHPFSDYRVSFDVLIDNEILESKSFTFRTGATN